MRRFGLLGTSALCSSAFLGLVAFSSPAYAQTTEDPKVSESAKPGALGQNEVELESGRTADEGATGEEITVTGSRIRRPNLESAVPITSVGTQELVDRGEVTLGDALNELPALRSTFSQANSTGSIGTAGLNRLDLRGLGSSRTLLLVNGRRHVTSIPGTYDVDVNTIPSDLLERVDVVTGGNSAIYGSDAIAGVVNFVLKRDYEGFKLRAQGGISDYGDRGSYILSGIAGKNFLDGRVNAAVAVEYARSDEVFYSDRPYLGSFFGTPGFNTVEPTHRFDPVTQTSTPIPNRNNNGIPNTIFIAGPRFGNFTAPGLTFNTFSLGGIVLTACPAPAAGNAARVAAVCTGEFAPTGGRLSYNFAFDRNGNLVRNDPSQGLVDTRAQGGGTLGGLGASGLEDAMLLPGLERVTANLLLSGNFSDAFQPFLEAKYVRITATQQSDNPTFISATLDPTFSINNAFLTPQARATLQTILPAGATTFSLQRLNNDFGTRSEDHLRETYRVVLGAAGNFADNFRYEVSLNYGRTETFYETGGNVHLQRYNNAKNAVFNSAGQIVCGINADASTTNDDPACVPINLFGQGAPSEAALNYIRHVSFRNQWAEQINAVAFVSGDTSNFFTLPGGPVGIALGAEYRREDAESIYDEVTQRDPAETFLNFFKPFTPPAIEIKEFFGEIRLPLLRNARFFEELSVEGAARYSDYGGRTGGVWAYNAGVIWAPVRDFRVRAGYARSVRAPNLGNLFASATQTFANGFVDPCNQTVINDRPNRVRNCAAAGIPTTVVVAGQSRPFTNTSASGISGFNVGNPDLDAEVGTSFTVGAVFTPTFVPGFSLTVDYYDIKVENVITGIGGQQIINNCYDDPVGIDNPACKLINRRRTNDPLTDFTFAGQSSRTFAGIPTIAIPVVGPSFLNQPFNFAALKARGIDFDMAYRTRLGADTVLNLRAILSHVINRENFTFFTEPTRATRIHGTLGDPEWSASFSANLDLGEVDFGYRGLFIGRQLVGTFATQFSEQGRPPENPDAFPFTHYDATLYHSFRIGFEPNERFKFYTGVDNAFNKLPPFALTGTGDGSAIFPNTGRFFYAGAEIKF